MDAAPDPLGPVDRPCVAAPKEPSMSRQDPWSYIRWSRRAFFGLWLLFLLGVFICHLLFPGLPFESLLRTVGTSVVLIGWVFILIPTSCPRCHRCFVLWNLPNWGYWFKIYFNNL